MFGRSLVGFIFPGNMSRLLSSLLAVSLSGLLPLPLLPVLHRRRRRRREVLRMRGRRLWKRGHVGGQLVFGRRHRVWKAPANNFNIVLH